MPSDSPSDQAHVPAAASAHVATTPPSAVTADHVERFREAFEAMVDNIAMARARQVARGPADPHLHGRRRPPAARGLPGHRQDDARRALANTIDCSHARIQFTPDLLPSDVTGVTVYDQHKGTFEFHPGPIFHHLVLADEINRASPKTQSALLEVMEEEHVTVDGITHPVPGPFMVIATQNPIEQAGTYRLPEAQLDRFLMKVTLGYPDAGLDRGDADARRRPRPRRAGQPGHAARARSPRCAPWPTRCTSTGR